MTVEQNAKLQKMLEKLDKISNNKGVIASVEETLINKGEPVDYDLWERKCIQAFDDNKEWFMAFDKKLAVNDSMKR